MSKKISQLTELTTVLDADLLAVVNSNETKKVTKANLLKEVTQSLGTKANQSALDAHTQDTNNPHAVTKAQVGLGNVDNTSDATKNSATATLTNKTLTSPTINTPTIDSATVTNYLRLGTNTVGGTLAINGDDSFFGAGVGGTGTYIDIGSLGDSGQVWLDARGSAANVGMSFRTKGSGTFKFQNGSVGIGTTSPNDKLEVVGVVRYGNGADSIGRLSYGSSLITLEAFSSNTNIAIVPSGSGLVKTAILDQNTAGTNTYTNNIVILTGETNVSCTSGASTVTQAVTFGITFTTAPRVIVCDAKSDAFGSTAEGPLAHITNDASTTGFTLRLQTVSGTWAATRTAVVSWIAIGKLS